jgi:hypothetical protein
MGVSFGVMPTMEEGDERSSFSSSNADSETSSVVRDSAGHVVRDVPSAYAAELEAAAANFVGMGGMGADAGAGASAGAGADAEAAAAYGGGVEDGSSATCGNLFLKKADTSSHETAAAAAAAAAAAPYTTDGLSLQRMSISRTALAKDKSRSIAMHASEVSGGATSISSLFGGGGVGESDDGGDGDYFGDDGLGSALPMSLDTMSKGLAGMFGSSAPEDEDAAAAAAAAAATATATAAATPRPRGIGMLRKPSSVAGGGAASTGPKKSHRQSTSVQLGFGKIKPGVKRNTISER